MAAEGRRTTTILLRHVSCRPTHVHPLQRKTPLRSPADRSLLRTSRQHHRKVLEGNLRARVDKLIRQSDYSKEVHQGATATRHMRTCIST
jgi:hypothetical protein